MGAIDPHSDITGLEPPVFGEGGGSLLGKLPIALEDTGMLDLYLAGLIVDA